MENYRDDNIPTVNNTAAETTDTDGTTADPAIPEKADDTTKQPETASHNHNVAACEAAAAAGQTVYGQDGMYMRENTYNHQTAYGQETPYTARDDNYAQNAGTSCGGYIYNGNTAGTGTKEDKKTKKNKKPGYITRKGFVAGLICCMIASSGITVGGLYAGGAFKSVGAASGSGKTETISATNYTLAKSTDSAKSVQEIVAMNRDAVVSIKTESVSTDSWMQDYVTTGAGSGVIVDSNGYVLTCNHVIKGASAIKVTLHDGTEYTASLVGADELTDVAVLKIDGTGFTAATYGNSDNLSVGDLAVAIGNPLGELGGTATTGIISALNRELAVDGKTMNLLQTDSSINPGNSGGGMFDQYGNLVGIVVAKSSGSNVEGLGFAIPINTAADIAKQLIENGKVTGRAYIGVNILDLSSAEDAMKYGVRQTGIYIQEVTSSEAQSAGFQAGDMIYYIGDKQIKSSNDIAQILSEHKPEDEITVTVIRNNETVEITTKLVER